MPGPSYVPPPWAKMGKPFCPEGGRYMLDARAWLTQMVLRMRRPSRRAISMWRRSSTKLTLHLGPTKPKALSSASRSWSGSEGSVEFKAVGQVVYRYESATSSETKDMVAKAVGTVDETPGGRRPRSVVARPWAL